MVLADLLEELVFGPGLGVVVDLEALLLERLHGALADIFEKEQAEFTSCERAEHAWLDDVVVGVDRVDRMLALAAKARVQIAG
jgi:hypothetical protein